MKVIDNFVGSKEVIASFNRARNIKFHVDKNGYVWFWHFHDGSKYDQIYSDSTIYKELNSISVTAENIYHEFCYDESAYKEVCEYFAHYLLKMRSSEFFSLIKSGCEFDAEVACIIDSQWIENKKIDDSTYEVEMEITSITFDHRKIN